MPKALIVIDLQNDFCPGGALPALGTGDPTVFLFGASLRAGMAIARILIRATTVRESTA